MMDKATFSAEYTFRHRHVVINSLKQLELDASRNKAVGFGSLSTM